MESLGGNEIEVEGQNSGTITVSSLHLEHSVMPRVGLVLRVALTDQTSVGITGSEPMVGYELTDVRGRLRWNGASGKIIEYLVPTNQITSVRSAPHAFGHQVTVSAPISRATLERLETWRSGRPPTLWFEPHVRLEKDGAVINAAARGFEVKPSRDHWLAYLQHVEFGKWDVIEILIPEAVQDQVATAAAVVSRARQLISVGAFSEAAGEVRKGIEALERAVEDAEFTGVNALAEKRVGNAKPAESYQRIISAIKQLAGGPHHFYGREWRWARAEAQYMVRAAEGLISLIGVWLEETAT